LLTLEERQAEIIWQIHCIFSVSFKTFLIKKPSQGALCSDEEGGSGRRRDTYRRMSWS